MKAPRGWLPVAGEESEHKEGDIIASARRHGFLACALNDGDPAHRADKLPKSRWPR